MEKSSFSKERDRLARGDKFWVRIPEMDYRQSSGVEYRGVWMTKEEYHVWRSTKKLPKRTE